jgi:4a-hydroxytetrahydrobiopterin dehydratase
MQSGTPESRLTCEGDEGRWGHAARGADESVVGATAGDAPERSRSHRYGSDVIELVNDHCQEYPPGTPPLSEAEVAQLLGEVPGWERDGKGALTREFAFDDFSGAFGLVVRVALLAEAESHHPRVELEWGRAAFATWTHTASGLTRNDFIIAAKINQIARA